MPLQFPNRNKKTMIFLRIKVTVLTNFYEFFAVMLTIIKSTVNTAFQCRVLSMQGNVRNSNSNMN